MVKPKVSTDSPCDISLPLKDLTQHNCVSLGEILESEHQSNSYSGHLASVHSPEEFQYLQALTQAVRLPLWIGGSARAGQWSWVDGSKFNYKNWAKGKPENFDPERKSCIQMNYGGLNMGVFTVSLLLIAVFSLGDAAARPPRCRKGWHKFGSHCFNFDTTPRSWPDAEKLCRSLGGHLASIHNEKEFTFLKKLTGGSTFTWIGGNDGGRPEITQHNCVSLGEILESEHQSNSYSGHLASVHSPEEFQYLQALTQAVRLPLWIGGSARVQCNQN
ncbi:hypothetical protein DPEC_G00367500 [Dallia pectoralis]|nr:hypothetical protein DPEC_G00367500 [Dallia pectoralis]